MTRLLPDLDPNAGVDRDELAVLLGVDYSEASEILLAELGDGLDVLHRYDEDGDDEWRLGDVEAIVERRRREGPRTFETRRIDYARKSAPPSKIELSDPGSTYEPTPEPSSVDRSRAAISLDDAADQLDLSADELQRRIIGRCKLGTRGNEIMVRVSDLDRLAAEGAIPKRSAIERSKKVAASIGSEDAPADPELDRRVAEAAAKLGMDPAEVGAKPTRSAADRRAEQVAKSMGIDYPR